MSSGRIVEREGEVFAIPLENGKYVIGLVARKAKGGPLGYFFGRQYDSVPSLDEIDLKGETPILIGRFSPLHIKDGTWTVIGKLKDWNKTDFPVPMFRHTDLITGETVAYEYTDKNLDTPVAMHKLTNDETSKLFRDVLMGAKSVEYKLIDIIEGRLEHI